MCHIIFGAIVLGLTMLLLGFSPGVGSPARGVFEAWPVYSI